MSCKDNSKLESITCDSLDEEIEQVVYTAKDVDEDNTKMLDRTNTDAIVILHRDSLL